MMAINIYVGQEITPTNNMEDKKQRGFIPGQVDIIVTKTKTGKFKERLRLDTRTNIMRKIKTN
jgi:hypothetical protein